MKNLHELDTRTRAQHFRWLRNRRRLMVAALLVGLLFATGAYAQIAKEGGSAKADHSAVKKVWAPEVETTSGPLAIRSSEPRHDSADKPAPEESLNILVLGVDRRPSAAKESSARSDTIMLVQTTPATGEIKLLSVPRDLYVEVEPGEKDRINSAYTYGGIKQARKMIERLTGVQVDGYVIADFEGFEKVIATIGGVKVDVGHGVFPEKWHMGEGVQRLGGRKALFYARYRGTACGDLDRIDHQQRLLAALREQALGWNTITKLPQIVKVTNENVDTDLGVLRAISLARALVMHGEDGEMSVAELKGYPTYLPSGAQVLMPNEEANEAILQDFRNDASKERESDGAPRPGGSTSRGGSSSSC